MLVAVDGSEHSHKAARVAGEIGRAFGGEVVVLHVREDELTWAIEAVLETQEEASELVFAS
ncbi:MAG TPA: universal stress protein [Actinomycetota bacterium]|nr:universal stress protein [Actinomycetota bacterium]